MAEDGAELRAITGEVFLEIALLAIVAHVDDMSLAIVTDEKDFRELGLGEEADILQGDVRSRDVGERIGAELHVSMGLEMSIGSASPSQEGAGASRKTRSECRDSMQSVPTTEEK